MCRHLWSTGTCTFLHFRPFPCMFPSFWQTIGCGRGKTRSSINFNIRNSSGTHTHRYSSIVCVWVCARPQWCCSLDRFFVLFAMPEVLCFHWSGRKLSGNSSDTGRRFLRFCQLIKWENFLQLFIDCFSMQNSKSESIWSLISSFAGHVIFDSVFCDRKCVLAEAIALAHKCYPTIASCLLGNSSSIITNPHIHTFTARTTLALVHCDDLCQSLAASGHWHQAHAQTISIFFTPSPEHDSHSQTLWFGRTCCRPTWPNCVCFLLFHHHNQRQQYGRFFLFVLTTPCRRQRLRFMSSASCVCDTHCVCVCVCWWQGCCVFICTHQDNRAYIYVFKEG